MVVSNLNKKISYIEIKRVASDDIGQEHDQYQMEIASTNAIITIGRPKKEFERFNVIFFPIYLVKQSGRVIRIGVFEIPASDLMSYLDENSVADVEKMGDPLLYTFATPEYIAKVRMPPEDDLSPEPAAIVDKKGVKKDGNDAPKIVREIIIPEHRTDLFSVRADFAPPSALKEESAKGAKLVRQKYHESETHNWVQRYMENPHYDIIDNEGQGDCLFATIRDAFQNIGQDTTVAKLRARIASAANEELFRSYKERFDMFNSEKKTAEAQSVVLKNKQTALKVQRNATIDRKQRLEIQAEMEANLKEFKIVQRAHTEAKAYLQDVRFMKDIVSLAQLKEYMQTCEFWADTWAISTLERILNVKLIILSSKNYKEGDLNNVMQCGDAVDPIIENVGEFTPEFYIAVDHTGDHYKLLKYKRKQIFTFAEIPYDLKLIIVHKCMERNGGIFSYIPQFAKFKTDINRASSGSKSQSEPIEDVLGDAKIRNLFDDAIVFEFYISSAHRKPGKGAGEKIPVGDIPRFTPLAAMNDWRRRLSDLWVSPFILDDHKWSSVEHFYQAAKFKIHNPDFSLLFSMDSNTELSKDPLMASSAGGTTGKYKGKMLRPSTVLIDPNFYAEHASKELGRALYAKFSQNAELKTVLLETQNAKLVHHRRARPPETANELMMIRDKLHKENT